MKIAVIGAGPIGLEAAAEAAGRGHDVTVYEAGRVGEHVRRWGHVTLFTPWSMAVTDRGLHTAGVHIDDPAAFPTGAELVADYLTPLARSLDVQEGARVRSVSRHTLGKGDALGSAHRASDPFRLVVATDAGEQVHRADVVFDCTGVFGDPAPAGVGGVAAPGEDHAVEAGRVRYGPADVSDLAGATVLLVGDGASAVTVLEQLLDLQPAPAIHWVTPSETTPGFVSPPDDVLPARARLFAVGAEAPARPEVTHHPAAFVDRLDADDDGVEASLADGSVVSADVVLSCTGFRPDHRLSRELQVHLCWGSEGPMKLAAALLAASGGGGDCMNQPEQGPEVLTSPEPRFFILGNKSYGRRSDFLLQRGHAQVRDALDLLESS